jgi:5-methyltetrahydropteroyltriglutamate--homocysteine methyltransferase
MLCPSAASVQLRTGRFLSIEGSTRPKPITAHDPDVFHPAATCKGRIDENIDLGLLDEFKTVSALTRNLPRRTTFGKMMAMAEAKHSGGLGI